MLRLIHIDRGIFREIVEKTHQPVIKIRQISFHSDEHGKFREFFSDPLVFLRESDLFVRLKGFMKRLFQILIFGLDLFQSL